MLRTFLVIAYLWPWFLCQSLPLMSFGGSRMGGSVRSAYKAGGAPGDSFSRVVGAGCEVSGVRQAMRLSLLGVGLLTGTHSSSAAQPSTGETRLCSSTLALDKVVNPPARVEDQIVVTKPSDERMYKALTLKNELRVLLVSDPSASRSAAAMDVHVGSMSDPDDIPGLAHFCEHMSFLGTKKFPDEEGFTSFLASHGGSSNAYTDNEDTVYYFDVNAEFLSTSLERFAQFFAAPLFTEGATSRELNAIDSEHAKNINNDGFRVYQLSKDDANPVHPFHKFATGNKQTLLTTPSSKGINVRQALLTFHSENYSANQMTLCIVGKEDLSELERLAVKYFGVVSNKEVEPPATKWWGIVPAYLPQRAASLQEVVPVAEIRRLTLSWPISIPNPAARDAMLTTKPESAISHLLGHEGHGSLRSFLVSKGWANGVQASPSTELSDLLVFEVSIELTEEGLRRRDDVVEAVFAYIDLLSPGKGNRGIPEYIFEEVDRLSRMSFDYSEKSEPSDYASLLVTDMQLFRRPSQYLTGSRVFRYFPGVTQCEVDRFLEQLSPQQLRLRMEAREFQGKTTLEGEWYGTQYNKFASLEAQTNRWAAVRAKQYPALDLPPPNELIPRNFDLIAPFKKGQPRAERELELAAAPAFIRNDEQWSVWHKLDRSFLQPRAYAVISLAVPADKYNAAFVVKSRLFANCFLDSINEFLYDARLAGLAFELEFTSKGMQLQVGGFSDKLQSFTERVLHELVTFRPDARTFARFKDLQRRSLAGWKTQQPYYHCSYYAGLATESLQWPIAELEQELKGLSVGDISSFLGDVLQRSAGTALVVGNVDAGGALRIVDAVAHAFPFAPLPPQLYSRRFVSTLPLATPEQSGVLLQHLEPNANDDNSAVTFFFQVPSRALNDTVLLEVLADAFEQGFYNTLRTQEQLGYIVYSGIRSKEGVYSLSLTVQSNVLDGPGLTRRVESYLAEAVDQLTTLSPDEFESFKEGLRVRKLEPDQRLTSQAMRLWSEVVNKDIEPPMFDRYAREVDLLKHMTQAQFSQFARELLGPQGARRRLLVSEINSQIPTPSTAEQSKSKRVAASGAAPLKLVDELAFRLQSPRI